MFYFLEPKPFLLQIGSFGIRYYSLAYVFALCVSYYGINKNLKKSQTLIKNPNQITDSLLFWCSILMIIFGRIFYIILYGIDFYKNNLGDIIKTWQGGMSFHGGLFGVILGFLIVSRKNKINFFTISDIVSVYAPIGIGIGRVANFLNDELIGRTTNISFAVVTSAGGYLPRHPSQIYEAILEGFLLFLIINLVSKTQLTEKKGFLSGCFMFFYGLFRCGLENFREPDPQVGYFFNKFTFGQILSIPMILIGVFLIISKLNFKDKITIEKSNTLNY